MSHLLSFITTLLDFPRGSDGKESACNEGDLGSISELGKSPGGGHGNPLQYSCLEKPHGQKSVAGYSPGGLKESDMNEAAEHTSVIAMVISPKAVLREANFFW